jgi:hypothetical protein
MKYFYHSTGVTKGLRIQDKFQYAAKVEQVEADRANIAIL